MKEAFKYLEQEGFMKKRFDHFTPEVMDAEIIQVTGDGNCFFRAFSKYQF